MEKELFIKVWRKLLIDLDMSEAQAAKAEKNNAKYSAEKINFFS